MSKDFTFKQFTISHDRCAMKVGTDGVLLGAWAELPCVEREDLHALDIGTGTGLIAIMLAQRYPTLKVDAIEIDADAAEQASENVARCPFAERLNVIHSSLQDFATVPNNLQKHPVTTLSRRYDLIVSNPPFYTEQTNCPDPARDAARHTDSLPIATLLACSSQMLASAGVLALIVPTTLALTIIAEASINGLYLQRRTNVRTTPRKHPKRTLLEFGHVPTPAICTELCLQNADGSRSDDYHCLTAAFYL